jgi:hypothetical protein
MAYRITRYQRQLLRFVAERSPDGEGFHATDVVPEIPGVDPGYALLTLEGRGLCWVEEPDIVGSTPAGLMAAMEDA